MLSKIDFAISDYKVYSVSYYNLVEEIYAYMSKLSKMGKAYWADISPAEYRHYKITAKNKKRKTRSDKGKKRK